MLYPAMYIYIYLLSCQYPKYGAAESSQFTFIKCVSTPLIKIFPHINMNVQCTHGCQRGTFALRRGWVMRISFIIGDAHILHRIRESITFLFVSQPKKSFLPIYSKLMIYSKCLLTIYSNLCWRDVGYAWYEIVCGQIARDMTNRTISDVPLLEIIRLVLVV